MGTGYIIYIVYKTTRIEKSFHSSRTQQQIKYSQKRLSSGAGDNGGRVPFKNVHIIRAFFFYRTNCVCVCVTHVCNVCFHPERLNNKLK